MLKTRHLAGLAMTLVLILGQAGRAAAAPLADPLIGTITGISEGTDSGGNAVIVVDYTDTGGNAQTAQLSLADAQQLGLITVDPITGEITIVATVGGSIDLTSVSGASAGGDPCGPSGDSVQATDTTTTGTTSDAAAGGGGSNPVAGALCDFFQGSLGLDYDTIMGWHEDGFGFGVIAQALFMAENLGVDPGMILDAKKSGDYSGLGLPEDTTINNWGQFKKFVLTEEVKSLTNLGAIMSGRAEPSVTETPTSEPTLSAQTGSTTSSTTNGHGRAGEHGKGKGGGKGKGHGGH